MLLHSSTHSSGHHQSLFFFKFSDFLARKSQNQQILAKKITHFTIQFRSRNLTHLTNLNSLDIENNMHHKTVQNLSDFTNFPANMFLFGYRKNIWAAPFLDAKEVHS